MVMSPAARPAATRRWPAVLAWAVAGSAVLTLVPAGRLSALVQSSGLPEPKLPNATIAAVVLAVVSAAAVGAVLTSRRIQAAVDRRLNRRRYDAARTIQAFSARLRQQVDLDTLTGELLAVVDQTVQPTRASLWLRPPRAATGGPATRQ
jgi:hypothetical protein